jgi:glycosyltransferase involved in cell wall biosynthesis
MGLRIGLFGTFHPEYNFAGNTTTPIALALARTQVVDRVTVFCQEGGKFPRSYSHDKVELVPCWRHNDPLSLISAIRRVLQLANRLDTVIFNTYVTAYGKSRAANTLGLLLPTALAGLFHEPTVVYMHNFVETQDVERLGYSPSLITELGVSLLERMMLRASHVVVPLVGQAEIVESRLGRRPVPFFFPFLESYLLATSQPTGLNTAPPSLPHKIQILLMGVWGPQKDLPGALSALSQLSHEGFDIEVTVTGVANPHFPDFLSSFDYKAYPALSGHLRLTGSLSEEELFQIVQRHDLLVLPYKATGGYSGAMNFAAVTGIPIVAYDHPQLREQAALIDADVTFVSQQELATGIRSRLNGPTDLKRRDAESLLQRVRRTEEAVTKFAGLLDAGLRVSTP